MNAESTHYTDEQLITRLWDKESIQNLMGRHSFLYSSDRRQEELDTLWVKRPENQKTASLGSNWGFYTGMENIQNYYVTKHANDRYSQLKPYCEADHSTACEASNLGLGCWDCHTISTPYIELAGDGLSARGLWYDNGQITIGRPDGYPQSYLICGLVGADLLKEDGVWKLWHLMLANDHAAPVGEDYSKIPMIWDQDPVRLEFGVPNLPVLVHDSTYGWGDKYPYMPEPYFHFSPDGSYGPEGKREKQYRIGREWDIKSCIENDRRGGIHQI